MLRSNHSTLGVLLFVFVICFFTANNAAAQGNAIVTNAQSGVFGPLVTDTTKNMTIQIWLNPSSDSQYSYPFYLGDLDSNGYGLVMHNAVDGNPGQYVSIKIAGVTFSATGNSVRLPLNQWTNVTMTRGDSLWHLYQNGELVGRGVGNPIAPIQNRTSVAWQFQGQSDEVTVWDRELTIDEIRAAMAGTLHGDEPGLIAYYPMDTTVGGNAIPVRNMARLHPETPDLSTVGIDCEFVASTVPVLPQGSSLLHYPKMSIAMPVHYQFFPRNSEGTASASVTGMFTEPGYDSIILEVYRNDTLVQRAANFLNYTGILASFDFEESIKAELALYTERLSVKHQDTVRLLREAADLVCGDAYLLTGQSNSHNALSTVTYESPYLRSFGVQTGNTNYQTYDPADTLWGLANGHGFSHAFCGPYLTGALGIQLQRIMQDSFKIPICLINGGAGASPIELHLRDNGDHASFYNVYGRALYRAKKAGIAGAIKAIFWYQGESNTIHNYYTNFHSIYSAWAEDYPGVKKIYLYQIRPGCATDSFTALRELQRTLPDSLPNIRVMSTVGVIGHDGCHFSQQGYDTSATHIFRMVAQDFYGGRDTTNIEPPNITRAFFTSSNKDTIACLFTPKQHGMTWPRDTIVAKVRRRMVDYFFVGTDTGAVSQGWFNGDTLFLRLRAPAKYNTLTYIPDKFYDSSEVLYEGPWLISGRNIGALTFGNVPIAPPETSVVLSRLNPNQFTCAISPNPLRSTSTLSILSRNTTEVSVAVFDALGRVVISPFAGQLTTGSNRFDIDLSNRASGMYFVRIATPAQTTTRSVLKQQ